MVQILPMAMITGVNAGPGRAATGSQEGLSPACLPVSSAEPLPAASFLPGLCQAFSLSLLGSSPSPPACLPWGACAWCSFD